MNKNKTQKRRSLNGEFIEPLALSKNMYELISSMNLGNLSALKEVPQFYYGCLLQYIMKMSLAFIHAHSNDLIHGNFNLSKVISQKMPAKKEHSHDHHEHEEDEHATTPKSESRRNT